MGNRTVGALGAALLGAVFLAIAADPALAQDTASNSAASAGFRVGDAQLEQAGYVLLLLLVLAIFLESALEFFFNWRVVARFTEGKGLKTPIVFIASAVFVFSYDFDAVAQTLQAFAVEADRPKFEASTAGMLVTALIVAGGSKGVFTLFEKLGIRNPLQTQEKAESAREMARLKLRIRRSEELKDAMIGVWLNDRLIGSIPPGRLTFEPWIDFGYGYPMKPGEYDLKLTGYKADQQPYTKLEKVLLAPRAAPTLDIPL